MTNMGARHVWLTCVPCSGVRDEITDEGRQGTACRALLDEYFNAGTDLSLFASCCALLNRCSTRRLRLFSASSKLTSSCLPSITSNVTAGLPADEPPPAVAALYKGQLSQLPGKCALANSAVSVLLGHVTGSWTQAKNCMQPLLTYSQSKPDDRPPLKRSVCKGPSAIVPTKAELMDDGYTVNERAAGVCMHVC